MDRGDIDHLAIARLHEDIPCVLRQQERTGEQDTQKLVPTILGKVGDRIDVLKAGARDQQIEPSKFVESCLDTASVSLNRGQIGSVRCAGTIRIGFEVDGEHGVTLFDQPPSDSSADTARRSRHQRLASWFHTLTVPEASPPGQSA